MLILAFDTATDVATSALVEGDTVLGERTSLPRTILEDADTLLRDAGRVPARRSTEYALLRVYEREEEDDDSPLDHVENAEARFGSYRRLTASGEFRFVHPTHTPTSAA